MFLPPPRTSHTIMAMSILREASAPATRLDTEKSGIVAYRIAYTSYWGFVWAMIVCAHTRDTSATCLMLNSILLLEALLEALEEAWVGLRRGRRLGRHR